MTLTDPQAAQEDKVQVYISGALHGNEILGPNVAYYLIEFLLSNYNVDPQINRLFKEREIIITPMTNAVGYHYFEREERINSDVPEFKNNPRRQNGIKSFDINRDFPYNTQSSNCLNTIAGRVVHEIHTQNVIVSTITFHGGTNVIGYSWGSYNRVTHVKRKMVSWEAPDFQAIDSLGRIMKNEAGGVIHKNQMTIDEYILGDMTSTVYPVKGGLEDWVYAAGWDFEND